MLREFTQRGVDPMGHLEQYLSEEEHAMALRLPPQSTELVDYVMLWVDDHDARTDDLRQMAYKLFGVTAATWVPVPPAPKVRLVDAEAHPIT